MIIGDDMECQGFLQQFLVLYMFGLSTFELQPDWWKGGQVI
jgi:hypothetical protein